jgi:hypothetical protein
MGQLIISLASQYDYEVVSEINHGSNFEAKLEKILMFAWISAAQTGCSNYVTALQNEM